MKRMSRMRTLQTGLALLTLLLVSGCLDEHVVQPTPVPIERLTPSSGAHFSGIRDYQRVVARDPTSFATWWKAAWPDVPVPEVDFDAHMVLFAAMGERPSGGYTIQVTEVVSEGYGLCAVVRSTTPGSHCDVATVMTQPVDFVSIPAHGAAVRFVEVHEATSCK
jgi:hypothetical protein